MVRAGGRLRTWPVAALATALLAAAVPAPAAGQTMTVQQFMDTADRIPDNFTAALHPGAHRLKREFEVAITTVFTEQYAARQAGRRPATCIPERFSVDDDAARAFFNAMPARRRATMTVTQGVRIWMAARFPCPA